MEEKTYKFDDSKDVHRIGVKKNKFTQHRDPADDVKVFDVGTGWPQNGYEKDEKRIEDDSPSYEGEAWFMSKSFNDEETNKRPLHPTKDYLNPEDAHTGDDHLEMGKGNYYPEYKIPFYDNSNVDKVNYDSEGKLNLTKKDGNHLITSVNEENAKDKHIYNINQTKNIMENLTEQLDRIKQMILFKEGMSFHDVQKLTEADKEGDGGEAVEGGMVVAADMDAGGLIDISPGAALEKGEAPDTVEISPGIKNGKEKESAAKDAAKEAKEKEEVGGFVLDEPISIADFEKAQAAEKEGKEKESAAKDAAKEAKEKEEVEKEEEEKDEAKGLVVKKVSDEKEEEKEKAPPKEVEDADYEDEFPEEEEFPVEKKELSVEDRLRADIEELQGALIGHLEGGGEVGDELHQHLTSKLAMKKDILHGPEDKAPVKKVASKSKATARKAPARTTKASLSRGAYAAPLGVAGLSGRFGGGKAKEMGPFSEDPFAGGEKSKGKGKGKKKKKTVSERRYAGSRRQYPSSQNQGPQVIKLKESDLYRIVERVIAEKKDTKWMQKADKDIEKRGTEGVFHKFCVDNGFRNGCSEGCWDKAKEKGGVWGRRAGLAKAYCESKH